MKSITITSHSLGSALSEAMQSTGLKESAFGAFLGRDENLVWQATLGSLYNTTCAERYLDRSPFDLLRQTTGSGPMTQAPVIRNLIDGLESIFEVGLSAELHPFAGNHMVAEHGYQITLTSGKAMPWFFEHCQNLDRKATWQVDAQRLVAVLSSGFVGGVAKARKCLFDDDSDQQGQIAQAIDKAESTANDRSGQSLPAGMILECIEVAKSFLCEMGNMRFEYFTQNESGVVDGVVVSPLAGACSIDEQIAALTVINQAPAQGILTGNA